MYMCRFDRLTGGLDIVAADQFFLSHCHSGNYHLFFCVPDTMYVYAVFGIRIQLVSGSGSRQAEIVP
jgi:hypothetical protein